MKTGLFIFCLLSCGFVAEGEEWLAGSEGTNSSEQYARDNYFSKRRSLIASSSTNISFYSGFSFYRRSSRKTFPLFSSVALGFNQQIKEISGVGDVHFQLSVSSAKMKEKRSYFLDLAGRFSAPAIRWAFPLYVGVGAGVGFAPLYLLRKISPFSAHGQFFSWSSLSLSLP